MRLKLSLFFTFSKRMLPALLIWAKLISDGLLFYIVRKLRPTEAFYFRNLGLTPTRLWFLLFIVDSLLFGILLIFILSGTAHA